MHPISCFKRSFSRKLPKFPRIIKHFLPFSIFQFNNLRYFYENNTAQFLYFNACQNLVKAISCQKDKSQISAIICNNGFVMTKGIFIVSLPERKFNKIYNKLQRTVTFSARQIRFQPFLSQFTQICTLMLHA